jgi:uncharacterized protein with PIN domain
MSKQTQNPLSGHFRAPKLYTLLPSQGRYYTDDIVEMPDNGELPIYPMTAKDELIMRNPDALLNGEAVTQVIASCVPNVKKSIKLMSNDVDALLLAIQGASYGDDISIRANCPECNVEVEGVISADDTLSAMSVLEDSYTFTTGELEFAVRPFTYETTIKAGIASFQSTRSLQAMADMPDDEDKLKVFNQSFVKMANVNFDIIVDSIQSITAPGEEEPVVVTDRKQILEFMNNCESSIGKQVEEQIAQIGEIGIAKESEFMCEECDKTFRSSVAFDPVNFSTAS